MTVLPMTRAILGNLTRPRATRRYPSVVRTPFEHSRGALENDIAACTLCGVCAVKCPSRCIRVDKRAATWSYDPFACVLCGVCVESCPAGSLRQQREHPAPTDAKEVVVLQGVPKKAPAGVEV